MPQGLTEPGVVSTAVVDRTNAGLVGLMTDRTDIGLVGAAVTDRIAPFAIRHLGD